MRTRDVSPYANLHTHTGCLSQPGELHTSTAFGESVGARDAHERCLVNLGSSLGLETIAERVMETSPPAGL